MRYNRYTSKENGCLGIRFFALYMPNPILVIYWKRKIEESNIMKNKRQQLIKKGFSRHAIRTDILVLQKQTQTQQSLMLALLSSVVFIVGFSFTLISQTRIEPVVSVAPMVPTALENDISFMVDGYPIEIMSKEIAKHDRAVAAFVVAIAKKESNWGKRSPKLDGKDCFNYWGFREKRERMGTGGHTCFDNPKDAVRSVSKRIENLMYEYDRDTPREMVVWKCGYSCAGHSDGSVNKWVSDVEYYYQKLKTEQIAQKL